MDDQRLEESSPPPPPPSCTVSVAFLPAFVAQQDEVIISVPDSVMFSGIV